MVRAVTASEMTQGAQRRLVGTAVLLCFAACSNGTSPTLPQNPLEQMSIAFEGRPSVASIKATLDRAMDLYGLPTTDENYSRAGSALVALRKKYGITEMEILAEMIRNYAPGVSVSFPQAAGIAAASLASQRR
jgi:hypothetical protein